MVFVSGGGSGSAPSLLYSEHRVMHCGHHGYDIVVHPSRNDVVIFRLHEIHCIEAIVLDVCNWFWRSPFARSGRTHDGHTFLAALCEDTRVREVIVRANNVLFGSGGTLSRESLD